MLCEELTHLKWISETKPFSSPRCDASCTSLLTIPRSSSVGYFHFHRITGSQSNKFSYIFVFSRSDVKIPWDVWISWVSEHFSVSPNTLSAQKHFLWNSFQRKRERLVLTFGNILSKLYTWSYFQMINYQHLLASQTLCKTRYCIPWPCYLCTGKNTGRTRDHAKCTKVINS